MFPLYNVCVFVWLTRQTKSQHPRNVAFFTGTHVVYLLANSHTGTGQPI